MKKCAFMNTLQFGRICDAIDKLTNLKILNFDFDLHKFKDFKLE